MSIAYLVSHSGDSSIFLDLAELETKLHERWGNIVIFDQLNAPTSSMYWEIDLDDSILKGRVLSRGDCLSLEGYLDDVAEFVVWYRSVVPLTQKLSMFDSGYNHGKIEIVMATTAEDIKVKFSGDL